MSCARLVPRLCSRSQPGIKVIISGLRGHLLHTVTFLVLSNKPGYLHPVCSELKKSGIRVGIGGCCVTEHWWWCSHYQSGKTIHMHAIHNTHLGNVADVASYPGTVASLNKHDWKKNKGLRMSNEGTSYPKIIIRS